MNTPRQHWAIEAIKTFASLMYQVVVGMAVVWLCVWSFTGLVMVLMEYIPTK